MIDLGTLYIQFQPLQNAMECHMQYAMIQSDERGNHGVFLGFSGYRAEKIIYQSTHQIYYHGQCEADNRKVVIKTPSVMSPAGKDIAQINHELDLLKGISLKSIVRPVALEKSPNGRVKKVE